MGIPECNTNNTSAAAPPRWRSAAAAMSSPQSVRVRVAFLQEWNTYHDVIRNLVALYFCMRVTDFRAFCFLPILACAALTGCFAHSHFRGVHPGDVAKYSVQDASTFSCGDGSSISWDLVNDDHCDCVSGVDEPGTSGKLVLAWMWRYSHTAPFVQRLLFVFTTNLTRNSS